MLWVMDRAGLLVHVRPEWETLTGQSLDEALGLGWLVRVHPDDRETVLSLFKRALDGRHQFVLNHRVVTAAGDSRWVVLRGSPSVLPETDEFIGFLGHVDVDDRDGDHAKATGRLGALRAPSEMLDGTNASALESLADHVIHARAMAEKANEPVVLSILDLALVEIGYRLAHDNSEVTKRMDVKTRLM